MLESEILHILDRNRYVARFQGELKDRLRSNLDISAMAFAGHN